MFYFHMLIGLISSKKYWIEAQKKDARFKRGNLSKILFLSNRYENPNERRNIEFFKS